MAANHFLRPLLSTAAGEAHTLRVTGRTTVLASAIDAAFDSASRKRGLLGRNQLAAGTALVIAPCSGIHTFGMQFPIDVVFAARDGRVLKIARAVGPRRIAVCLRAFAAIEFAAGEADRCGVRVGDFLELAAG